MRAAIGLALGLVAAACATATPVSGDLRQAIAEAAPGATLTLEPGRYRGPLVIDKPLSLIGTPGAVIVGRAGEPTISVLDVGGVEIRNLAVEGGSSGIEVRDSEQVLIRDVAVVGADLHGIFVDDSEIRVSGCEIRGLTHEMAQGVEIINSIPRPPSLVEHCTVYGPVFEGLVTHVSRVEFRDNEVIGSNERGIVITEMSTGTMEGNKVRDAVGSAYFCGDMSRCSIVGNEASGVADARDGWKSSAGHGLVVHFHSEAFVDNLALTDIEGDSVLLMLDSTLASKFIEP